MRKRDADVLRNGADVVFIHVAVADRPAVEFARGWEVVLANGADEAAVMLEKADQPVGFGEALVGAPSAKDKVVLMNLLGPVPLSVRDALRVELKDMRLVAFAKGAPPAASADLGVWILADAVVTLLLPLLMYRVLDEPFPSTMTLEFMDDGDIDFEVADALMAVELRDTADNAEFLHVVELAYLVRTDVDVTNAVTKTLEVVKGIWAVITAGVMPRQEHAET